MTIFLKFVLAVVLISSLLFGCDTRQQIDREAIKKEMRSRELSRFTESEVLLEAERVGGLASTSTRDQLAKLIETYHLSIDTIRWDDAVQDSTISNIMDVYKYANTSGLDVSEGVQASTEKLFYYCIPFKDSLGSQGVTILTLPKKEIVLNFPKD